MIQVIPKEKTRELPELETPSNATRTSDYGITDEAREAYAGALLEWLERADDLVIVLEARARLARDTGERVELTDFIREQGYDPAEFQA